MSNEQKELKGDSFLSKHNGGIEEYYYTDQQRYTTYMPTLAKTIIEYAKKDPNYHMIVYAFSLCQMVYIVLCWYVYYIPPESHLCAEVISKVYNVVFTKDDIVVHTAMIDILADTVVQGIKKRADADNVYARHLKVGDLVRFVRSVSEKKTQFAFLEQDAPPINEDNLDKKQEFDIKTIKDRCEKLLTFYETIYTDVQHLTNLLDIEMLLQTDIQLEIDKNEINIFDSERYIDRIVKQIINKMDAGFVFKARENEMNLIHMVFTTSNHYRSAPFNPL